MRTQSLELTGVFRGVRLHAVLKSQLSKARRRGMGEFVMMVTAVRAGHTARNLQAAQRKEKDYENDKSNKRRSR
jgi:hypothetical protein